MSEALTCNLCGQSRDFAVLWKDDPPYRVLKCGHCSLVFVHPQPDPDVLAAHYDPSYYSDWMITQARDRAHMWEKRVNRLTRSGRTGRLLDVGCGEGAFLQAAKRRGWQVDGTELSSHAARTASSVLGVNIFRGELVDAPYPSRSFDTITFWHVLEHVRNPMADLSKARDLLRSGGLLILAVPNVHNLVMQATYRLVRGRKMKLFSPEDREVHLYHFSPATIESYLHRAGFECLKLFPDYGIIQRSKKILNWISVVPYYLAGIKIFDAMEIWAVPASSGA